MELFQALQASQTATWPGEAAAGGGDMCREMVLVLPGEGEGRVAARHSTRERRPKYELPCAVCGTSVRSSAETRTLHIGNV